MWLRVLQHRAVVVALSEEANYTLLQVLHHFILLHEIPYACTARGAVEHLTVSWSDDAQIVRGGTLGTLAQFTAACLSLLHPLLHA